LSCGLRLMHAQTMELAENRAGRLEKTRGVGSAARTGIACTVHPQSERTMLASSEAAPALPGLSQPSPEPRTRNLPVIINHRQVSLV